MSEVQQICPRAGEDAATLAKLKPPFNGEMVWRSDNTCSYCGSLHPDTFMERLEAGTATLEPTDKSYKVYVRSDEGRPVGGPSGKFYFQHLSETQRTRFIELHNEGRLKIAYPGHFYTTPFFCKRVASTDPPARVQAPDDGN